MDSGEQRKFWDQHIAEWAMSAYEKDKTLPFIEEIAKPWRQHLKWREDMAVEIVNAWGASSVVELGCGMSEFAAALPRGSGCIAHSTSQSRQSHRTAASRRQYQPSMSWILNVTVSACD